MQRLAHARWVRIAQEHAMSDNGRHLRARFWLILIFDTPAGQDDNGQAIEHGLAFRGRSTGTRWLAKHLENLRRRNGGTEPWLGWSTMRPDGVEFRKGPRRT
jgi:hypothetical protein